MIVRRIVWLMLVSSLLQVASVWSAESRSGLSVTPFIGWHVFEGNQYLKDRPFGGVALGYDFRGGWSVETAGTYVETKHNRGPRGRSVDIYTLRVDVLKHFRPEQRLVPYAVVGAGALLTEEEKRSGGHKDEDPFFAYGVGLKYYLPDDVALRLDLRHLVDYTGNDHWEDHDLYHNAQLSFGITVPIGRKRAPAAQPATAVATPAPIVQAEAVAPVVTESVAALDSDGDGVDDSLDICRSTPAGVAVDATGCPPDSDGDGIEDSRDRCEVTPPGTPVDEFGCPRKVWRDTDGDGVADDADRCPNTPPQLPVNAFGCPRDSDGDTIFDMDDRCPDTPAGTAVDASGCPVAKAPGNDLAAAIEAEKRGLRLNILFAAGKSDIPAKYQRELAAAADYLNANPQGRYIVEGHTDSVGNDKANRALSEKRARSVRSYLIDKFKIAPARLEARGLGESRPIGNNATVDGRVLNRRVVLVPLNP